MDLLSKVLSQIRKLAHALDACLIPDVEKLETELMEIRSKTDIQDNTQHFEWVDGGFLKAVQNGDWVLLENANLCNPTVSC
jgi:midasin